MAVDPPPSSNEACMLGELKLLIDQLDQQTKATMKDSLYRISRHAQVRPSNALMALGATSHRWLCFASWASSRRCRLHPCT